MDRSTHADWLVSRFALPVCQFDRWREQGCGGQQTAWAPVSLEGHRRRGLVRIRGSTVAGALREHAAEEASGWLLVATAEGFEPPSKTTKEGRLSRQPSRTRGKPRGHSRVLRRRAMHRLSRRDEESFARGAWLSRRVPCTWACFEPRRTDTCP